jgi:hypothetical protein
MIAVEREILELHERFVAWFGGAAPATGAWFKAELLDRLTADFTIVPPSGQLLDRATLFTQMRQAHGSNPDFRIQIRAVRVHTLGSGLELATYEEWQRNARNSTPPDNGRVSSALLVAAPDRPTGVRWRHVHETWLPAAIIAAGPYDF